MKRRAVVLDSKAEKTEGFGSIHLDKLAMHGIGSKTTGVYCYRRLRPVFD